MSNTLEKLSQEGFCSEVPAGASITVDPGLHDAKGNLLIPKMVSFFSTEHFEFDGVDQETGLLTFTNKDGESTRDLRWFAIYPHSIQYEPLALETDFSVIID